MIKNFFTKSFLFIRQNIKTFCLFFILLIILTFEFPYYIETPGGIIETSKRFEIDSSYDSKGSFNLAYVGQLRATLPLILYAKINQDWEVIPKSKIVLENETIEDVQFRDHLMLEEANHIAIKLAYQKAKKEYHSTNHQLYVTYIDNLAKTNLKIQDQIIKINHVNVSTKKQLQEYINQKQVGEQLEIEVMHKQKKYIRKAKVIEYEHQKLLGILVTEKKEIQTNPSINIQFKNKESGASGGFMMTLSIYNALTPKDLTQGLKIVGTGTINEKGIVGPIDGVKYKLMGAVKQKADLFFVPSGDNYKEAIKTKKEKHYSIKIVPVNNLDDAINYLQKE